MMIRIFSHYVSKTAFILLLLEISILLTSAALVSMLWLADSHVVLQVGQVYLPAAIFALVIVFSMSALGMYRHCSCEDSREDLRNTVLRIVPAFGLGFAVFSLLTRFMPALQLGRGSVMIFGAGAIGVLLARLVVFKSSQSALMEGRLILVGGGALACECMELAASKIGYHQFTVVGCLPVAGEACCVPASSVLSLESSLLALAQHHGAGEIVVSVLDRRNGAFPVRQLLECVLGGVKVIDAATFFEREACQIRIDTLQPSYLIYGGGFDQGAVRAASKRLFDLVASGAICLLTLPLMLLTMLCIRLDDGGPVFYQQERIGRDGAPFKVLKFRSMRCDAEADGTPTWAAANDVRVTRVGALIRKLRIDELPQMFNVFRGEMSFVGPRPERAYFVEQLRTQVPYYNIRHGIKPGITGLAQVRYHYGASVDDAVKKLQYDLYYVKNNSLFLDVLILLDTVQVVLFGKGSR